MTGSDILSIVEVQRWRHKTRDESNVIKITLNVNWFLVWFLFYSPSTHFRSFRARSVNLATLFLGKPTGSLPVLSAHSFASNWQLLFLSQRKRENGPRNVFMTKSPRKNVPDVGIELKAACMPSEHASDRATAPSSMLIGFPRTDWTVSTHHMKTMMQHF